MRVFVVLHDIRSAHNVGSILRTCDGAGVATVFLAGYTPAPVDRFGRLVEEITKTALGAEGSIEWRSVPDTVACIESLRSNGVEIVAVEQHERAVPYSAVQYDGDVAFIFGNEVEGVPPTICELADTVVHIPMHGTKESLNVGVSAGIVLFHAQAYRN